MLDNEVSSTAFMWPNRFYQIVRIKENVRLFFFWLTDPRDSLFKFDGETSIPNQELATYEVYESVAKGFSGKSGFCQSSEELSDQSPTPMNYSALRLPC